MTLKSKDDVEFTYSRTWEEIENMLEKAERTLHHHEVKMTEAPPKSKRWAYHARNFKALQGVIKTLRWTLGDRQIEHPLE